MKRNQTNKIPQRINLFETEDRFINLESLSVSCFVLLLNTEYIFSNNYCKYRNLS